MNEKVSPENSSDGVSAKQDDVILVGNAVRQLRKSRGMTIQQLAAALDRSAGYVSQIERGISEPTLKDLYAVSTVFGVAMSWFLHDGEASRPPADERDHIVRSGRRRLINHGGISSELLTPQPDHKVEFMVSTFSPGAVTEVKSIRNLGTERGLIMKGSLELHVDEKTFLLGEGDSYLFERTSRYWSRNPSTDEPTVVLWVSTI